MEQDNWNIIESIWSPNNKSKTFIELSELENIIEKARNKLKKALEDWSGAEHEITCDIINRIFGDELI